MGKAAPTAPQPLAHLLVSWCEGASTTLDAGSRRAQGSLPGQSLVLLAIKLRLDFKASGSQERGCSVK